MKCNKWMRLLSVVFLMTMALAGVAQETKKQLNWEITYHKSENAETGKWMPAMVPGAVQLDVMKAENYKQPYWFGDNVKQFDWMEDWFFTYRTTFKRPALNRGQRLYFKSKGIDYEFKILLNGLQIHHQEGMFSYVDLDLTDGLKENNELKILILPVPKIPSASVYVPGTETYRQNARESAKPAVSYGWDWHPRLVTRGIWDDTYLEVKDATHLTAAAVTYQLNDSLSKADIRLGLMGSKLSGAGYKWTFKDKKGKLVFEKMGVLSADVENISLQFEHPELWWPNGYGEAVLYNSEVTLSDSKGKMLEKRQARVGFRSVKMIMNEGEWDKKNIFPVTRNRAPASIEINGKRIFAKGSNWVHPEIFVGLITKETYEKQIQLAKEANFNMLRVWGGGIVNKESFFDLCDEKGIMVWQEFPLACNNYTDKPKYLAVLEQEATAIINRVKTHASLTMWSGGNELFNAWSGMTEQSHALRLLNALCYRLDPTTPFIYTSPLYGMGHGSYVFYDKENANGKEVFQWMPKSDKTAYTEFGIPGVASVAILKKIIPASDLFPPKKGTAWETHHAFGAWGENRWLELPFLEDYFGKIKSIEELVEYSQLTQAEGLKFIYEEARRQKPYCSMALNWCFQEPWPTAANNSLINWPNELKPAYHEVANACRPVLASIRPAKFLWTQGEDFSAELYMLNDTYESLNDAKVKVILIYDKEKEITLKEWAFGGAEPFKNAKGPQILAKLPAMKDKLFKIKVTVEGHKAYDSWYTFLCK